jgi:hypothetical protein
MRVFSGYRSKGFFWFRIFGYGFTIKNNKHTPLTFSQRFGYRKYLKIGDWVITFLKPHNI